jgi:hypothetical protein
MPLKKSIEVCLDKGGFPFLCKIVPIHLEKKGSRADGIF